MKRIQIFMLLGILVIAGGLLIGFGDWNGEEYVPDELPQTTAYTTRPVAGPFSIAGQGGGISLLILLGFGYLGWRWYKQSS